MAPRRRRHGVGLGPTRATRPLLNRQHDGPALEAVGLTKRFDDFVAVAGIDLGVDPGETFSLLGPNGAGKSSTMKMVSTVSPPSGGTLRVLGLDTTRSGREIRARIGVVPQEDNLDLELTVRENLVMHARYFGLGRAEALAKSDELLDFAQLADRADAKVDPLSGGMKRRLTIARSLVNDPELVLLDEPTTGLDPQARHLLWERLYRLKESGVTLLLTTHYMDEAEQLSDRLVVMDGGRIVAEGSPSELIARHASPEVVELRFPPESPDPDLERLGLHVEVLPDRTLVYAERGEDVLRLLEHHDVRPSGNLVRRSTLEDVFLAITGRRLVE